MKKAHAERRGLSPSGTEYTTREREREREREPERQHRIIFILASLPLFR
jgi:hypothetical protein